MGGLLLVRINLTILALCAFHSSCWEKNKYIEKQQEMTVFHKREKWSENKVAENSELRKSFIPLPAFLSEWDISLENFKSEQMRYLGEGVGYSRKHTNWASSTFCSRSLSSVCFARLSSKSSRLSLSTFLRSVSACTSNFCSISRRRFC